MNADLVQGTWLVLHEPGQREGGAPWVAARSRVIAPDIPGHGDAPLPSGVPENADPAWAGDAALAAAGIIGDRTAAVIVGVGDSSPSAELLAVAGKADALVLVDGLYGPWQTPAEQIDASREWLRSTLDAPGDDRIATGYAIWADENFSRRMRAEIAIPVLAVETPRSPTPPEEVGERLAHFAGPATMTKARTRTPDEILPVVERWLVDRYRTGHGSSARPRS